MSKNGEWSQLELDFSLAQEESESVLADEGCCYSDDLETLSDKSIETALEFTAKSCSDVLESKNPVECNEALSEDSDCLSDASNLSTVSIENKHAQDQILERRQELLQKRKRFVQTVLDAIYDKYTTEIDELIALEPKWQTLAKTNFDRVKRWGVARFMKQIVVDDQKLKDLLKIKVEIDGSKKAIKDLPYIKSFLARCRVGEDRLLGVQSVKGDANGEIAARNFQKIKDALEDYRLEALRDFYTYKGKEKTYQVRVNGKAISLKNELKKPDLRNEIKNASLSISDLESFRVWLCTNFSLEQVSIKNSDENILFCVFVSSLRNIVGKKILPTRIDTIELYKSLLNGRFIPETLRNSPFKIGALDTTFIEYRDSLWKSYFNTPDFFTKYPSYYFWLKNAPEAEGLNVSHLGDVWGMIPDEFREHWSYIDLPFNDADKLYKVFEKVQNNWIGNEEANEQFFKDYPSYYFWLKDVAEAQGLNKSNLGSVWGMIPDEFRSDGRNDDKWSVINLPFNHADKLHTVLEHVQNSWKGNTDAKTQFFKDYPSYYFWLKNAEEANDLNESNLGNVWGMIPDEFRERWSMINLPFKYADKLHTVLEHVQNSWKGNTDAKTQFFKDYPSYYFWLKNAEEANDLNESHLGKVWGMIPYDFREKWSKIDLPFKYADKLHTVLEHVQNSWKGNTDAKTQFFKDYPSYYFWLKNAEEANDLNESHLGKVWGMIPDEFRERWSMINLPFEYADKLHVVFEEFGTVGMEMKMKKRNFAQYPSYYFGLKMHQKQKV